MIIDGGNVYGKSQFNTNYYDNKYVGYMFGGEPGVVSSSREEAVTNTNNSTVKVYLDTWYQENILETDYEDYISDTLFCNDRQLRSEVGGSSTGTGFGTSPTWYAAYYRLYTNKTPNIKCGLINDRFTVSDTTSGNGALTYSIGLLTLDEAAIAGLKVGTSNSTNYLYTNQVWWTMCPSYLDSVGNANAWRIGPDGYLADSRDVGDPLIGARGVLNLKSNTLVIGTGTTTDPYIVEI